MPMVLDEVGSPFPIKTREGSECTYLAMQTDQPIKSEDRPHHYSARGCRTALEGAKQGSLKEDRQTNAPDLCAGLAAHWMGKTSDRLT